MITQKIKNKKNNHFLFFLYNNYLIYINKLKDLNFY